MFEGDKSDHMHVISKSAGSPGMLPTGFVLCAYKHMAASVYVSNDRHYDVVKSVTACSMGLPTKWVGAVS